MTFVPPVIVLDVVRGAERDARALLEQTALGVEMINLHYDGYEPGTPDLPGVCVGPSIVAATP